MDDLTIRNTADIYNTKYPDPVWVIDRWLHYGYTLLSAPAKHGKSFLSLQCALSCATGSPLFGKYRASCGRVLYMDFENGEARFHRRVRQMSNGPHGLRNIDLVTKMPELFGKGGEILLGNLLKAAQPQYSLVIIDTLRAVFPGIDSKDIVQSQYNQSALLKEIADVHKVAILGLMHSRKGKADTAVEQIGGSSGVTGGADSVIILHTTRKGAFLELASREAEDITLPVRRNPQGGWEIDETPGGAVHSRPVSAAREEILALLASRPLTPTQIAQKLHKDCATIRQMVKRLKDQNVLEMFPDGSYGLLGNNDDDIPFAA